MNKWLLAPKGKSLYRILNNTGKTVYNVKFGLQGPVVAGVIGSSQWTHSVEEIAPNAGIEEVFVDAYPGGGAITIKWSESQQSEPEEVYQIPFG